MAASTPGMFAWIASRNRYQLAPHLQLLDDYLHRLARGDIRRLMVFMPPRSGKSLLCSQYFPAWFIGAYRKRVILTSYESSLAAMWGRLSRDTLTEWGPQVAWSAGPARVSQVSSAADHWELEGADGQRGVMHTAGVGTSITGRGADLLIIDDPVKNAAEAASATLRNKAWQWYTSTAYTRLEPDGRVLVIQTRWHADDLSGRILRESEHPDEWTVLSLPAIAEQAEHYPIAGCAPFTREIGDALWPARFSPDRLAAIRQDVGGKVWAALYQQRPTPDGGLIWRREWFRPYRALPTLARVIQTVDTAFKTGVASDYSVIATWGATPTDYYLVDVWRARVEFPDLKRAIVAQAAKHQPDAIYIEDAASGQSALQELRRDTALPLIAVKPLGSKEGRAAAVSPLAEAGKVWIPDVSLGYDWLADWLDEHVAFPNAVHDDQTDTTSMALERLRMDEARIAVSSTRLHLSPEQRAIEDSAAQAERLNALKAARAALTAAAETGDAGASDARADTEAVKLQDAIAAAAEEARRVVSVRSDGTGQVYESDAERDARLEHERQIASNLRYLESQFGLTPGGGFGGSDW